VTVVRLERVTYTPGRSDLRALDGVDLALAPGEVVVVEGPSGGGKSTLLRAIAGLVPHFRGGRFTGRVTVMGRDTRTTAPGVLARHVGSLFQEPETQAVRAVVARDVAFGLENSGVPATEIPRRIDESLDIAGVLGLREREIATLSGGERQRVALAGVLAARPDVLLLDEPTSQLDAAGTAALCETISVLRRDGVTIVIGEHRGERMAHLADRTIAMRNGRIGDPQPPPVAAPVPRTPPGDVILSLSGIDAGYGPSNILTGCRLDLRAGSITALHGPNGSGKSTLSRVIAGLLRPVRGHVQLRGIDITDLPAEHRHPAIGLLTQDAGRWLLRERVDDEVAFGLGRLPVHERTGRIRRTLAALDLAEHAGRHPLDLSVGERERVALAAVLAAHPDVIVLDEPSRGMDPARKAALAGLLAGHAARGAAVLVATHDAEFADHVADRHVDLIEGQLLERDVVALR